MLPLPLNILPNSRLKTKLKTKLIQINKSNKVQKDLNNQKIISDKPKLKLLNTLNIESY